MTSPATSRGRAADPETRFAAVLHWGSRAGLFVMLVTYALYVSGAARPLIPLKDLPRLWRLPSAEFRAQTGAPARWDWLRLLDKGDMMNFLGMAMLGVVSILCLLATAPLFFKQGDRLYGWLAIAEACILAAAASGWMG